jgi:hypothetical protein
MRGYSHVDSMPRARKADILPWRLSVASQYGDTAVFSCFACQIYRQSLGPRNNID